MRCALLITALLALGGCNRCDAGTCNGCCSADGECVAGTTVQQCGTKGAVCSACSASDFAQCVIGECVLPALISGPTTLDFGGVGVNTQATGSVTLTNSGDLALVITDVTVDRNGFAVEPVPTAPIDPKQSVVVTFDFTPDTVGVFTSTAVITSNAGSHSSYDIALTGTGN
ncbi:MAG: DUF1573 domain-containing protein [Myxococcaceae bacterium]